MLLHWFWFSLDDYQTGVDWLCLANWHHQLEILTEFLRMTISWRHTTQGRVAMRLRRGGIFNYHFIANLLQSLTLKEFWKSVKIWYSYWHKLTAIFYETVYMQMIYRYLQLITDICILHRIADICYCIADICKRIADICNYTVSQKTSHLWLAITLMHMNGFWYFLAEMLLLEYAIKRRFTMPPQVTCASALPGKNAERRKSHVSLNWIVLHTHNAPVCYLPERKNCHLWCVW